MYLTIPLATLKNTSEARTLLLTYPWLIRNMKFSAEYGCYIPFTDAEELLLTKTELQTAVSAGFKIQQGTCYVEVAASYLDGLVPATMPDSTYVNEAEETVQRTWGDYAPFRTASLDGTTVCIRCAHVPYGATNGATFTHEELVKWVAVFGLANVMVAAEGKALLSSAAYLEEA